MNWIDQASVAIGLTLLKGTLGLGFWKLAVRAGLIRNPQIVYLLLRLACILFVMPFGYLLIQLTVRDGFIQTQNLWQLNFHTTGMGKFVLVALCVVWAYLLVKPFSGYIRRSAADREFYAGTFPENDEKILRMFGEIQKQMNIHGKITVCRNDQLSVPNITGIFRHRIVLPCCDYSGEQLRVIFTHELMHYKSRDVFFKLIAIYIDSLLPVSEDIPGVRKAVDLWSEYYCDMRTVRALGDDNSGKYYFELIMSIMRTTLSEQKRNCIFSMLGEAGDALERRIEYMKRYKDVKLMATGTAAALAFAFLAANVSTVYAAGSQLAQISDYVYESSYDKLEDTVADGEEAALTEEFLSGAEDGSYSEIEIANPEAEEIMPILDENQLVSFNWSVSPHVRMVSSLYSFKKGQKVAISTTVTPSTNTFWIGIMNDFSGDVIYVSGKAALSHTFTVPSNGSYRIFVQNESNSTINSAGSYYYYS